MSLSGQALKPRRPSLRRHPPEPQPKRFRSGTAKRRWTSLRETNCLPPPLRASPSWFRRRRPPLWRRRPAKPQPRPLPLGKQISNHRTRPLFLFLAQPNPNPSRGRRPNPRPSQPGPRMRQVRGWPLSTRTRARPTFFPSRALPNQVRRNRRVPRSLRSGALLPLRQGRQLQGPLSVLIPYASHTAAPNMLRGAEAEGGVAVALPSRAEALATLSSRPVLETISPSRFPNC